jgi:SAM-dependent methyltransferase
MNSAQDPASPAFWDALFRENRMPWDAGATPPELERHLAEGNGRVRVLVPGCGSAYEVRAFAEAGREVVAIDFSAAAVKRAKALLGEWRDCIIAGDFFTHDFGGKVFDVVYERAFLASLPRLRWPDYAQRLAELIRPGGQLIGFFVYGDDPGGPPFWLRAGELSRLLSGKFDRIEESAASASVPVFAGRERWEVWVRKR